MNPSSDPNLLDVQSLFPNRQTEPVTSYFRIHGLNCPRCAGRVETALSHTTGVKKAIVEYPDGLAEVSYDPKQTSIDVLTGAVRCAGDGLNHNYRAEWLE